MTAPAAPVVSLDEMLTELEREYHIRRSVYARLVDYGKLKRDEADRRQQRLHAAIVVLREVREEARHP